MQPSRHMKHAEGGVQVQPTWSTCSLSSSSTASTSRRLLEDFTQEHMAQRRKLLVDPADKDSVISAKESLKGAFCGWVTAQVHPSHICKHIRTHRLVCRQGYEQSNVFVACSRDMVNILPAVIQYKLHRRDMQLLEALLGLMWYVSSTNHWRVSGTLAALEGLAKQLQEAATETIEVKPEQTADSLQQDDARIKRRKGYKHTS